MLKFFLRTSPFEQGIKEAMQDLLAGQHRHDVLEHAVRAIELDPTIDSVGYGGFPNILGDMELDGFFMDGDNRRLGAVAAVKKFLPVRVARALMEEPTFHNMLVGLGAVLFAYEKGLNPEPTLTEEQRVKWERNVKPLMGDRTAKIADIVKKLPDTKVNRDTVIMLASDGQGLSGAGSTSGWAYKYPGRVGDSPLAGAGYYVDSRFGGAAVTHTGEMSMRAGTARYVVAQMEQGKSPEEAVDAACRDLINLQGGVLRTLVIHAINCNGDAYAAAVNAEHPVQYQYWCEGMLNSEQRASAIPLL